jgi:hypothetical protein
VALAATRKKDGPFGARYRRLLRHRGHANAIIAVAHALLRTIYHVLATGQEYARGALSWQASCSRGVERDVQKVRGRFSMLKAFSNHPQSQGLYLGHGLATVGAVAEHTRQCGHLGEPAAVVFLLQLDREGHEFTLHLDRLPNKRLQPTAAGRIMRPPRLNRRR